MSTCENRGLLALRQRQTTETAMYFRLSRIPIGLVATIAVACLVIPPVARASNLGFLNDSPVSHFNDEDLRLQREAALKVLENKSSRTKESWKNPANGHSGKIEGLGAFTAQNSLACRRIRVFNRAEGLEGQAVYTVCKDAERGWLFNPGAQPAT
jgi:hypothetical protein